MLHRLFSATILVLGACAPTTDTNTDMEDVVPRSGSFGDEVEVIAEFNPMLGETPESVAVGLDGSLYVSLALTGEVRKIAPNGVQSTLTVIPLGPPELCQGPFPGILGALTVDLLQNVYVNANACDPTNKGVWRISPSGVAKRIASLPPQSLGNGIALFGSRVYVSDSTSTTIWRASIFGNGAPAEAWAVEPLLADPDPFDLDPGANGLQFYGDAMYVANSGAATIVEIPLEFGGPFGLNLVAEEGFVKYGPEETNPEYATPEVPGCDDFAFDLIGRLYCTTDPYHSLLRIDTDGGVEVLLDGDDGVDGPTSAAFGRWGDLETLYVSNAMFPFFPSAGNGPSVLAIDIGFPGYPLR